MTLSFSEAYQLNRGLEKLQELLKSAEAEDRNLRKYLEEKGDDFGYVQNRIDQYMIQRGQIAEVFDILDGLKVTAR